MPVLDILRDEIDRTIRSLDIKDFEPDPIAGKHFSKITSVMSSAYKRHGHILERAILEALRLNPVFVCWRGEQFLVPETVDHIIDGNLTDTTKLVGVEHPYGHGSRVLQVDIFVYNQAARKLCAYEVKRGFGWHDAGRRRSMLRDVLAVQLLLKSYGQQHGHDVQSVGSHVIFYYGKCSLPKPYALVAKELDEHFGCDVSSHVEGVNAYYQSRLFSILSGAG